MVKEETSRLNLYLEQYERHTFPSPYSTWVFLEENRAQHQDVYELIHHTLQLWKYLHPNIKICLSGFRQNHHISIVEVFYNVLQNEQL